jgi:hypothetical protein
MLKKLIPEGKWSRITLLWSFSQFIIMSIIEFIIIKKNWDLKKDIGTLNLSEDQKKDVGDFEALITYQILYILALTYQLYLTVDTLLKFSTIDLIALAVFNSMCLVYSVTQYLQANTNNKRLENIIKDIKDKNKDYDNSYTYEYINIGVMLLYTIGWWYITFRLYKVFGWNSFKQIGADISLKNRLKLYNILFSLLKITFFFIDCLFLVQYFALDNDKNNLTGKIPLAIITVVGSILGFIAVIKESRLCLAIFIFTLCVDIGFMCFVLSDMFIHKESYRNSITCLTVTIVCTILLSLVSYGVSIINFKNFGLGIPKSINKSTTQSGQAERVQQKRLSID